MVGNVDYGVRYHRRPPLAMGHNKLGLPPLGLVLWVIVYL